MAFNKTDKADGAKVRRGGMRRRKKVCVFCGDKNGVIDYKDTNKLKRYVSERGKILPRRITGNCAVHHGVIHKIRNKNSEETLCRKLCKVFFYLTFLLEFGWNR